MSKSKVEWQIPYGVVANLELRACENFLFRPSVWAATIDGMLNTEEVMWERVRKWEKRGMQFDVPTGSSVK